MDAGPRNETNWLAAHVHVMEDIGASYPSVDQMLVLVIQLMILHKSFETRFQAIPFFLSSVLFLLYIFTL